VALELSRIDRLAHEVPGDVDVALLSPRAAGPTADTVWLPGEYAEGVTKFLFAGPDADPAGAIVVPSTADLWKRTTDGAEVDAERVGRITVLGGSDLLPTPAPGTGAVIVVHGNDANRARPATSLPIIWFGEVQPTAMTDADVYVATVVQN
jgi:hypothetical protein